MVDLTKYKDIFLLEVEDHLQKLNDNLLKLEKDPKNKDLLNELMRSSHTIKASSATMEYKKTAFLSHVMEDVFDYMRSGLLEATPKTIDELFKSVDVLEKSILEIKKLDKETDLDQTIEKLKKITGVANQGIGKSARGAEGEPGVEKKTNKVFDGKKTDTEQPANIERISHIKVPVERLDNLMDSMEELLIDKMRLEQLKKNDSILEEVVDHLSRLVSSIQYQVMQARLVPVEQIIGRFPRMVRDLALGQKKDIEFEMIGGEIEMDRTIIDKLGEPLMHLLRNAIDHGIDKKGKILLKVSREREFALISVEDNGRGIDFKKIKEAAVRRNIVSEKDIESFGKEQLINLLFHSYLSTKEKVTETSGRGVGLSVVKGFADQIGGRVLIEPSLPAGGARFILELPLTLAIINALLVLVQDFIFAIPFSSIERSVIVSKKNIKSMADYDVAVIDGKDVLLAWPHKIFNLSVKTEKKENFESITVVMARRGKDTIGLVVDKLINRQEIIVKSLSPVLRGIKGFSGSTILGDGMVALIIDVAGLLENKSRLVRTF